MKIRSQLPVYSPVSLRGVIAAAAQTISIAPDPRGPLRELLRGEYGASDVVLCGSGTQALSLAIHEALDRGESESLVALPAFSCFDVATAAIGAGVSVSLYDVDPCTLGPDHESLERVLAAGARVGVIAPLYGIPLDWNALTAIAERHGAGLIEDAAQGNGARWDGKRIGARGEIATLSFGRGKGWTGGHGGALLLKGAADSSETLLAPDALASDLITVASLAAQWLIGRPSLYGVPRSFPSFKLGETVYHPPRRATCLGRAATAAIVATKDDAEKEAAVRKVNAEILLSAAASNPQIGRISTDALSVPGYLRLPLRLPGGMSFFADADAALSLGVARSYPSTLAALQQLSGKLDGPEKAWPGAEALARDLVTLPTHSLVSAADLSRLAGLLRAD